MRRTSSLNFLFVTVLIDVLGIGLMFPILPDLVAQLTGLGLSAASRHYGWLLSLYGAMQFLFSPLLGMLSDRFGRRPLLLLSLFFAGLDYVLMALAPSMLWLYIGRILSGITGANMTVASAYIADVSPPEKRAQNFGIIGAAFGVGFVIGPALGGVLGHYGPRVPFWASALLCGINWLYGFFILPESLPRANRRAFDWKQANPLGALRVLGRYPAVWGLTAAMVVSNLGHRALESTWVLFSEMRFGWDAREVGFSLAAFGAMALVYQLGIARVLLPRWGERRTIVIGFAVSTVELLAYAFATRGWMIYAIMLIAGLGMLGSQAAQGLLSRQVGQDEQGTLQGALTSLTSLTGIFGPVMAASLFAHFTRPDRVVKIPGAPFFVAAFLNAVALVLALSALRRMQPVRDVSATARPDFG